MPSIMRSGVGGRHRLHAALDALPTNCLLADRNLKLVYMNRRSEETLRQLEPIVRESFGLGFAELVGGSIHRFHRDPARIERILSDPANFPHRAVLEFGDVKLQAEFNVVQNRLGRIIGYVVSWSEATGMIDMLGHVGQVTDTLRGISKQLGDSAEVASSQSQMIASGAEEMNSTIGEISQNASEAAGAGRDSVQAAEAATDVVTSLEGSSQAIDEIVELISTIADQTKLLALNATIEAARAGAAGSGFAVVADEVKELANQTSAATERIGERIASMRQDVVSTGDVIRQIREQVGRINEVQETIAAAIEEQTATTAEMTKGIASVAQSNNDTVEASGTIAQLVEQTGQQVADLRRELGL